MRCKITVTMDRGTGDEFIEFIRIAIDANHRDDLVAAFFRLGATKIIIEEMDN